MFAKLTTVFAVLAVAAQVAVAVPPACLIAAVNTQDDPTDMKSVCGASAVKQYITKNCGDNTDAANSAFAAVCKDAGVSVSMSSSSSSSSSASITGSATGKSTGTHSSTTVSGSASGTSFPSGTLTGGYRYPVGTSAAASSGFMTATANGTYSAPTSSGSSNGSSASPSASVVGSTGGAGRLGMDVMGMAVVGLFGAMMAL